MVRAVHGLGTARSSLELDGCDWRWPVLPVPLPVARCGRVAATKFSKIPGNTIPGPAMAGQMKTPNRTPNGPAGYRAREGPASATPRISPDAVRSRASSAPLGPAPPPHVRRVPFAYLFAVSGLRLSR